MSNATNYLQPYQDHYWGYADEGRVIETPYGLTLAYTEQLLQEFIPHLAPQGLPRFGSLILAVVSTTTNGLNALDSIWASLPEQVQRLDEVAEGYRFAKLLTEVPHKVRQGNLRIVLLQAIFQDSHNGVGLRKSGLIAEQVKSKTIVDQLGELEARALTDYQSRAMVIADFKTLALAGRELKDVPAILQRIAGLPPVTEVLQELQPEQASKPAESSFVERLINHRDTFHVGALVPNLISGLQLSFHASLPSEQPLGGTADITNKGSFDKLLTSEFAFDDHVLLSRLANNEALYKHREVPPTDNDHPRVLLIDNTLKNWGTIRTLSLAAAIAIAEHPKNKQPCRFFLVGKSYREVNLATVPEVIEALRRPDPTLDPGVGITELLEWEDLRQAELFFLGAESSATTSGMQQLQADSRVSIEHWIHSDVQGVVRLYKHPKRGKRLVQELRLPLEVLWKKPTDRSRPTQVSTSTKGFKTYPILFPEMRLKSTWRGTQFTYGITKSRCLVRLYGGNSNVDYGWEFIAADIRPKDNLKAAITNNDGSVSALFASDAKEYSVVNYPTGTRTTVPLNWRIARAKVFFTEEDVFKTNVDDKVISIDQEARITESERVWLSDHYQDPAPIRQHPKSFFRDITRLSINSGMLCFRGHALEYDEKGIYINQQHRLLQNEQAIATETAPGTWTFPDGSNLVHHSDGLLILQSPHRMIPTIYLPARLDTPLGAATEKVFTGPKYFQKQPLIDIHLKGVDEQWKELVLKVNTCLRNCNLSQVEKMLRNNLITCYDESTLAELTTALSTVDYEIRRRGLQQKVVPTDVFFEHYLQPFIDHILDHAAKA